jgi:hypothetical protein
MQWWCKPAEALAGCHSHYATHLVCQQHAVLHMHAHSAHFQVTQKNSHNEAHDLTACSKL